MKFILHSHINETNIRENMGRDEYSYYFVLKAFQTPLEQLGSTIVVHDPKTEVDPIYDECSARGEGCVYLSFSPPHKSEVGLRCPTVTVVAWEFSTLPDQPWDGDPRNDWRYVFEMQGQSIALSSFTARLIKDAMGADFPVAAIAAPVWDRFAPLRARLTALPVIEEVVLRLHGIVFDSRAFDITCDDPNRFSLVPLLESIARENEAAAAQAAAAAAAAVAAQAQAQAEAEAAVAAQAQAEAEAAVAAQAEAERAAEIRRSLRFFLSVTWRYFRGWYGEAVRDVLPSPLSGAVRRAAALLRPAFRAMTGRSAPDAPEPEVETPDAPEPEVETPDVPEPEVEAPVQPELDVIQPCPIPETDVEIRLGGVVYTSVFSPVDGRKSWTEILNAFCWTFREVEDATLVLKMVHADLVLYHDRLFLELAQLSPFKCRVVALHGYLENSEYERLIEATSYYVNASSCEGLCLPLMEFMAGGRPVIAPRHTAMEDYIDSSVGFVLNSSIEHNVWPHDPEYKYRTYRRRPSWISICAAFKESYEVAKTDPGRYAAMAALAPENIRRWASNATVAERLRDFFTPITQAEAAEPSDVSVDRR